MLEKINFKNYKEMTEKSEVFKQGVKDFKEDKVKRPGIKSFWVKKLVSAIDWKKYYSYQSSYCFLKQEGKSVWVGFLVANQIPRECEELDEMELLQVDDYRRAYNVSPFPLEKR